MWKYSFLKRAAFLIESHSCMQRTINSNDEQKTIFTWSNLGKTFKLGKSWQVLQATWKNCLIRRLAQNSNKANVPKRQLIGFLRIFWKIWGVFSKWRKRFRQGSHNYDLDKRILVVLTIKKYCLDKRILVVLTKEYLQSWQQQNFVLTKEYLLSWQDMWFMHWKQQGRHCWHSVKLQKQIWHNAFVRQIQDC